MYVVEAACLFQNAGLRAVVLPMIPWLHFKCSRDSAFACVLRAVSRIRAHFSARTVYLFPVNKTNVGFRELPGAPPSVRTDWRL